MNTSPEPLWLLAAPFSGVAWLAASLGRHPDFFVTPELDLLLADNIADALSIFSIGQGTQGHGLLRAVAWLEFQRDDDAGIRLAQKWLQARRGWSTPEMLNYLAAAVAPRRLVIPERDATLRPIALARLQAALPQSKVLHLVRHPWEQGVLLHAWAMERLYVSVDFKDFAQNPPQLEPQLPWLRANKNIAALARRLPGSQYFCVQAEQVENDPGTAFAAICAWLGVPLSAQALAAMQRPEEWRFSQLGPDLAPGGLEPEAFEQWSSKTLRLASAGSLDKPLPWRVDGDSFSPQVRDVARQAGYRN